MTKNLRFLLLFVFFAPLVLFAGNPDRQGEAGAYELVLNPWARSAGLHGINIGSISGVEAMRINPAGIGRINSTEILFAQTRYLIGADINLNAGGFAKKMGNNGALGLTLMAVDFGDIRVTTTDQPEGTGVTYSPSFFNIGLGYAHSFEKVSVGVLIRVITESTSDISSTGAAIDAGVQYVTGPKDNIKFGIAIRNIGTPMKFGGPGISAQSPIAKEGKDYPLTYSVRGAVYELPSLLNIGLSVKSHLGPKHTLTVDGGFVANSFAQDAVGIGLEYGFNEMFMLRGGYKYEISKKDSRIEGSVDNGPSAGVSIDVPLKKKDVADILGETTKVENDTKKAPRIGIDYAYKLTAYFGGIHSFSLRLNF